MACTWRREKKSQPGNRPAAWYLQDQETEHTHMRVVWLNRDNAEGWYYTIQGPSHVARKVSPLCYVLIASAKRAARVWWMKNRETHLKQFEEN
jgi:hypothetical protein